MAGQVNREQFVKIVRSHVIDETVEVVMERLQVDSGGEGEADERALISWFRTLPIQDKRFVRQAAEIATSGAAYNFVSLLDNVVVDENEEPPVLLDLYTRGEPPVWLNDPNEEALLDHLLGSDRDDDAHRDDS